MTRRSWLVTLCRNCARHGDPEYANRIQPPHCFDCQRRDGRLVLFGRNPHDRSGHARRSGHSANTYARRPPQLEWRLAGHHDGQLGLAGPRDASCRRPARSVPGRPGAGRPGPGAGLSRRRAARTRRRRRQRDSLQARGRREKERQCRTLAGSRPRSPMLHAGDSTGDVHALSVSDHAGHEQDRDVLRICRRQPHHSPRPGRPAARRHLDGPFGRPLGRQHTGRRREPFQRPDLVLARR